MKKTLRSGLVLGALLLHGLSNPAMAEVKTATENGFSVLHIAEVEAPPMDLWKRLIAPKSWWNKSHSWSGSVEGFTIDPRAGGCFCETIQEKSPEGKFKNVGSVEHMRVIYAHPGKVLRMQGALGPLQSEAILGTLTIAIESKEEGAKSKISFSYVVGGYNRYQTVGISTAVDKVLGEQFTSLISPYLPKEAAAQPASETPAQENPGAEAPKDPVKPEEWSLDVDKLVTPENAASDGVDETAQQPKGSVAKPIAKITMPKASATSKKPPAKSPAKSTAKPTKKPASKLPTKKPANPNPSPENSR